MIRALALLLVASCAACVGQTSDEASSDNVSAALVAAPEAVEPCGKVLTPEPALLEETTRVAARWSAATGCNVRVGENGTPVRLVAQVMDGDVEQPGRTLPLEGGGWEVVVSPLRLDARIHGQDTVLAHEVGHALNPHDGHVEAAPGEKCTALMCSGGGLGTIIAADLEYVCDGYPCASFTPEG